MSPRDSSKWQVMLADLALILFLTTASSLAVEPATVNQMPTVKGAPAVEPVSVFRVEESADFSDWLASRVTDPRERLTILARFAPGRYEEALANATALAIVAGNAGFEPFVSVEPGLTNETFALFAFADRGDLARNLQARN